MTDTIKADDCITITLQGCNDQLSNILNAEVILIRSPIYRGLDDIVRIEIEEIVRNSAGNKKRGLRKKLAVLLETTGGSVEVVERISNVFRKYFKEVIYIVPGYVYSAGTVLVLSGDDIYMDYYSVLGPIDPQIEDDNGKFVPGMGYLYMYEDLIKKSANDDITNAELLFLAKRFDPATMFIIEQAKNHSEDLIKEWLPKYKFKNWKVTETKKKNVTPSYKKQRAAKIAKILSDASKWHSHGRGITMRELIGKEIKLKIKDFGEDADLNRMIRQYYDLFIDYGSKIGAEYAVHTKYRLRRIQ